MSNDIMGILGGVEYETFMTPAQASMMGVMVAMLNVALRYKYGTGSNGAQA